MPICSRRTAALLRPVRSRPVCFVTSTSVYTAGVPTQLLQTGLGGRAFIGCVCGALLGHACTVLFSHVLVCSCLVLPCTLMSFTTADVGPAVPFPPVCLCAQRHPSGLHLRAFSIAHLPLNPCTLPHIYFYACAVTLQPLPRPTYFLMH